MSISKISSAKSLTAKSAPSIDLAGLTASPRVKADGGILPPMVSYAQNFEDVMLRRALQDIESGYYVDIGAADPDADSVTRWFYHNGWRGLNVEPDPRYFPRLEERRPEDTNIQCAVGATSGNMIFNITPAGGLSTGNRERLTEIVNIEHAITKPIVVPAVTLDQLLTLTCGKSVEFLKIDVEGMEYDVISAASLVECRPIIIVVEATMPNTQHPSHQVWEPILLERKYRFAWFDGLNRFYVREEDEWRVSFFKTPPCYFDNFLAVTIGARVNEVTERTALVQGELAGTVAALKVEAEEARRQAAETEASQRRVSEVERARLQEGATAAQDRAEASQRRVSELEVEGARLQEQVTATARRSDLLREMLAQRESDYQRLAVEESALRQRVSELEVEGARLQEEAAAAKDRAEALQRRVSELEVEGGRLQEEAAAAKDRAEALQRRVSELEVEGGRLQEEAAAAQDRAEASQRRVSELEVARQAGQAAIRALAASTPVIAQPKPRWIFKRRKPTTIMRADQARDAGQWQIAAGLYRIALDRNPKNPPIWMQYGHAIKESGNLADAEVAYRIAIEYDPGDADGSLQLGHVLKLQGKQAEAEIAYLQALMLNSSLDCAARELFELGWTAERLLEMGLIISRNFERL